MLEAAEVLEGLEGEHEVLVVDDGSTDRTLELLRELETEIPSLRVLVHQQNRGLAAAIKTVVTASRGKYVAQIGADQEWRMDEFPKMLATLKAGADVCIGVRRSKQYSLWRKIVSTSYNLTVAALWGKHFGDLGSIKMARGDLWRSIPFESNTAAVNARRILIAYSNGAQVATVPVDHVARRVGVSRLSGPTQAVRAFVDLLQFRVSAKSRQHIPPWR